MEKHDHRLVAATFTDQHETPKEDGRVYRTKLVEEKEPRALSEAEKVRVKKNGPNLAARVAPLEEDRLGVCSCWNS